MNNKEIKNELDKLSLNLFNGTQNAFYELETIKRICMNIKISVAHLGNSPDTRALSQIGDIIIESVNKIWRRNKTS